MRPRPTYANVVSTLALVLVVSGGAYAATQLPKHSVGNKQIKPSAVNSKKVKNASLKAVDVRAGELAKGLTGTPLGGDLTGIFPNPTLAADVLDGMVRDADLQAALADYLTEGEVNDAITGALDDGVVLGDRDDASLTLPGPSTVQPLVSIPGVISVTARCSAPPLSDDRGLEVTITNESPGTWTYLLRRYSEAGPAVDTIDSDTLLGGTDALEVFAPDDQVENVRYFSLTVLNGRLLELEISAITRNIADGCNVRGSVFLDGNGPV